MKSVVLALFALALLSGTAAADLTVMVEMKDMQATDAAPEQGQMYLTGDKIKMDMAAAAAKGVGDNTSMVYRGDLGEVWVLDHSRKMYMVIDKESMQAVSQQLNDAMKQMEAQLEQMPEEQRKMMEQYMKGNLPQTQPAADMPVHEVTRTDRKEKINGYDCVCYELSVDGVKSSETWVTSWDAAGVKKEEFDVFHDMTAFYRELLESMPTAGKHLGDQGFFNGMNEIDGFPILIREFEGSTVKGETLFKTIEHGALAPATFDVPEGYRKQEMLGRG